MPEKTPFVHKLLARLEKIDPKAVKSYLLKLAETGETLRDALHQVRDCVLILDQDAKIEFANHAAELCLGIRFREDAKESVLDLIKDPELLQFLKKSAAFSERKVKDFQLVYPKSAKVRVILTPLEKTGERKTLILVSDLDPAKNAPLNEEQLARIAALISLAAGVAHEIGNPLNAIGIHLELIKKDLRTIQDPRRLPIEKNIEIIAAETRRLDKIVRNFLKATRKPPLRFQIQNLNEVLESALNFMMPELKEKKIAVKFKSDTTLPDFLMDRERLYQSFLNLIKNAEEAMEGKGSLIIHVSHKEKAAIIQFKDTGKGIAEEDLSSIFDAYYTTKEEGSGLGLMTVYDAVKEHGGQIEVSSKVGKGTTFTLMLPIRQPKLQLPDKTR